MTTIPRYMEFEEANEWGMIQSCKRSSALAFTSFFKCGNR